MTSSITKQLQNLGSIFQPPAPLPRDIDTIFAMDPHPLTAPKQSIVAPIPTPSSQLVTLDTPDQSLYSSSPPGFSPLTTVPLAISTTSVPKQRVQTTTPPVPKQRVRFSKPAPIQKTTVVISPSVPTPPTASMSPPRRDTRSAKQHRHNRLLTMQCTSSQNKYDGALGCNTMTYTTLHYQARYPPWSDILARDNCTSKLGTTQTTRTFQHRSLNSHLFTPIMQCVHTTGGLPRTKLPRLHSS